MIKKYKLFISVVLLLEIIFLTYSVNAISSIFPSLNTIIDDIPEFKISDIKYEFIQEIRLNKFIFKLLVFFYLKHSIPNIINIDSDELEKMYDSIEKSIYIYEVISILILLISFLIFSWMVYHIYKSKKENSYIKYKVIVIFFIKLILYYFSYIFFSNEFLSKFIGIGLIR